MPSRRRRSIQVNCCDVTVPCYNNSMTKTLVTPHKTSAKGYTVGRSVFAKISAVEGIRLTPEMEAQFKSFDALSLSAEKRREALASTFGKAR